MIDGLRKCFAMVPARLRSWWVLMPVTALIGGLLEGAAAGAVFGLAKVISDPSAAGELPVVARIIPYLPWQESRMIVLQLTAALAVYYVGKNGLIVAMQYVRHRIQGESSAALAGTMLRGYLLVPYPFHFRRNSAELIRNTTNSVGAAFRALDAANNILSELVIGAGILAVLLIASPGVTLVTAAALALLVAALLRVTRRIARRAGEQTHALGRTQYQTLQNALGGIKDVKALGREEFFYRRFDDAQRARLSLGYLDITMKAIPHLVIETTFVCGALLVMALITLRGDAGSDLLPLAGLFAYAGFRMVPMANRVTWRLHELRVAAPAINSLYDDYLLVTRDAEPDEASGESSLLFHDRLVMEDVSYTYPGSAKPAIHDVSAVIRRGESIGIVGPTGAGKSTLVDLMAGLLSPTSGTIRVDGSDISGRGRAWRRHIGYVPQSIFLLDDTLRRNIALGIPDVEIDDDRVLHALRLARLDALVQSLPDGLETEIGERGVRLSSGERQRVGIARALYHDPDVLIFDEATSALDNVTETEVTRAVEDLHGRKTLLVIAHRLTTVRNCDRLMFIADGRVTASGSWDELLRAEPEFRRMAGLAARSSKAADSLVTQSAE